MQDQKVISVFGSSRAQVGSEAYEEARTLGRLLAQAGFVVMNGGYSGTMEAVSRGAKEGGGQAVGITTALFDSVRPAPNAYLDREIKKPDYLSRLRYLVEECDGCIGLRGSLGTLTEVSVTWASLQVEGIKPKPLIVVGDHWRRTIRTLVSESFVLERDLSLIHIALTPEEAVQVLTGKLSQLKR